jgi:hypothetical protein
MRRIAVVGRREYPPAGPARPADARLLLLRFAGPDDIERWSSDLKMQMCDARCAHIDLLALLISYMISSVM